MKNIHLIPTDKPSRLYKDDFGKLIYSINIDQEQKHFIPQNIYITDNSEIKEGDAYITKYGSICKSHNGSKILLFKTDKKIILTTDQDLIADGNQEIDDKFLQWFVKNSSCEYVKVKKQILCEYCGQEFCDNLRCRGYKDTPYYKIIIPKEEPKQEAIEEAADMYLKKVNTKVHKDLERDGWIKIGFIEGAKRQAERMYSEEEVLKFAEWIRIKDFQTSNKNNWIGLDMEYYTTQELFEQFKNKL